MGKPLWREAGFGDDSRVQANGSFFAAIVGDGSVTVAIETSQAAAAA